MNVDADDFGCSALSHLDCLGAGSAAEIYYRLAFDCIYKISAQQNIEFASLLISAAVHPRRQAVFRDRLEQFVTYVTANHSHHYLRFDSLLRFTTENQLRLHKQRTPGPERLSEPDRARRSLLQ